MQMLPKAGRFPRVMGSRNSGTRLRGPKGQRRFSRDELQKFGPSRRSATDRPVRSRLFIDPKNSMPPNPRPVRLRRLAPEPAVGLARLPLEERAALTAPPGPTGCFLAVLSQQRLSERLRTRQTNPVLLFFC